VPRKIGIVDDSVTIRTAFQLTFAGEDLGVESHGFASVDEALKATDKYDLLYVDTKLGADDGYSACARLRSSPAFAAAPVVMLFGPWETYDEPRAKGSGAVGGIQKPWESDDIIARTQAYLSGAPQPAAVVAPVRPAAPAPAPVAAAPATPPARPVPAGAPIPPAPPPGQRIPTQIQVGSRSAPGMPGGIPSTSGLTKPLQPVPTPGQAKPAPVGIPPSPPAQAARTPLAEFAQAAAPARAPAQAPAAAYPEAHAAVSAAATAGLAEKLAAEIHGLSHDQIEAIVKIVARDIVEQVAWEVVPDLAETIIREQIQALLKE
jgi:CheY-like chemotaxis protein